MEILSNGSKWAGQEPDTLEQLLEVLKTEPLDPTFEQYGNFYERPSVRYDDQYACHGNFDNLSHVFDIRGTKEELEPLRKAIRRNQRTPAYKMARERLLAWRKRGERKAGAQ